MVLPAKVCGDTDRGFSYAQVQAAVQADASAARKEFAFRVPAFERWLAPRLCDQRDLPVLSVLINVFFVTCPSALVVFSLTSHLTGLCHLTLNYVLLLQRFLVALLHVTEHRRLFSSGQIDSVRSAGRIHIATLQFLFQF